MLAKWAVPGLNKFQGLYVELSKERLKYSRNNYYTQKSFITKFVSVCAEWERRGGGCVCSEYLETRVVDLSHSSCQIT